MDLGLKDKKVVVTGGSSGIGKAVSEAFEKEGAQVFILDKKGGFDASNESDVERFHRKVGKVDILVNNAGIIKVKPFENQDLIEWRDLINSNLISAMVCCKVFGKDMIEKGRGKIINIISTDAFVGKSQDTELGVDYAVAYAATKGALLTLTKALAVEWARYNINVNGIAPSLVETGMTRELFEDQENVKEYERRLPLGRLPKSEDITNAAVFLASEKSCNITGHVIPVDSGYLSL